MTGELLKRAQPALRRARAVLSLVQRAREALGHHRALVAGVVCATGGVILGVLIERGRRRRRIRNSPGAALRALLSGH